MRYVGEVKFRFVGDRDECIKYIPYARKVLGMLHEKDIVIGGLSVAYRRVILPEGVIVEAYDNKTLPIVAIHADAKASGFQVPQMSVRLVWMPKGIVLTPVSDAFPEGYGLPSRDYETGAVLSDPLGTPAGRTPQVIINQHPNNNYLDKGESIRALNPANGEEFSPVAGENLRLRDDPDGDFNSQSIQYQSWHTLYQPLDCGDDPTTNGVDFWADSLTDVPGVYQGDTLVVPQFDPDLGTSMVFEPEADAWYVHRPEEALYYYPGYEGCFQYTNNLRNAVGRDRVFRPTRGRGDIALTTVTEIQLTGLQYHENEEFRPGFRSALSRTAAAMAPVIAAENLQITPYTPDTFEAGELVAEVWEDSPSHYANMISAAFDTEDYACELFTASGPATITDTTTLGLLGTPVSGDEWVQNYVAGATWVPCPFNYTEGEIHVVGTYSKFSAFDRGSFNDAPSFLRVTLGQTSLTIPQDLLAEPVYAVLGAAFYQSDDGSPRIRCVVACGDQGHSKPDHDWLEDFDDFVLAVLTTEAPSTGKSTVTYEGDDYDAHGECRWEVEEQIEFTLADEWLATPPGQVKFSPDGRKFVFTMSKLGTRYPYTERYLTTYLEAHDPVGGLNDLVDVDLFRFEYVTTGAPVFEQTQVQMPDVVVHYSETRDGSNDLETSSYTRSVNGEFPCFFDYDDTNTLIWARCSLFESQSTNYPGGPNTSVRRRDIIFPSGKSLRYMDEDQVGHTGTLEFLSFYHIDVRTEDCVFSRRVADSAHYVTQENLDNSAFDKVYIMHTGEFTIEVDIGPLGDNETDVIWSDGEGVASAIFNSNGNGYNADTHSFEQPRYTYQAGQTPIMYNVGSALILSPTSQPITNNSAVGGDVDYINSIILQNHKVNFLAGMTTNITYTDDPLGETLRRFAAGNVAYFGTRAVYAMNASLRQASVAPAIIPDKIAADCQVVRYKDRVILRLENYAIPWRNLDVAYSGEHDGFPVIDTVTPNWMDVPADAEVIVWANFDVDSEVGIGDVTDIQPFGRVG